MHNRLGLVLSFVGCVTVVSCGGDDRFGDPIHLDPSQGQAAADSVASMQDLSQLGQSPDADTAMGAAGAFDGMMELMSLKLASQQSGAGVAVSHKALMSAQGAEAIARFRSIPHEVFDVDPCVTETPTSVTFNNCVWEGISVDGTVSWDGVNFSIDLTMSLDDGMGSSFSMTMTGSIAITPASIVGDLHLDMDASGSSGSAHANFDATYDVTLTDGCPTGGDVEVHAHASSGGYSNDVWVRAEFGPACGDVTLY